MKNSAYSIKNSVLARRVNIKSFEKKPIKGGTPAIENSSVVISKR